MQDRPVKQVLQIMRLGIIFCKLETAAEYADIVCIRSIDSNWMEEQVLLTEIDLNDLEKLNETSVGNLAYVALYHKKEVVREKAKALINQLKNYLRCEQQPLS